MKRPMLIFSFAFLALLPQTVWALTPPMPKTLTKDTLVRGSRSTVYYYAEDGYRYVFPNEKTYASWFTDFSSILQVTDDELAAIPLKGNVTYRPGVRLVKFQTDPKVYAVNKNGTLRWVETEELAETLYGKQWNKTIDDIPDAFFTNYAFGESIKKAEEYAPEAISEEVTTINKNMGIPETPYAPKSTSKYGDWFSFLEKPLVILPEPARFTTPPGLLFPPRATTTTSTPPIIPPLIIPLIPPATTTPTTTPQTAPPPVIPLAPPPTAPGATTPSAPPPTAPPTTATSTPPTQTGGASLIISNIFVAYITPTSATITWTTNEEALSQVDYRAANGSETGSYVSNNYVTSHSIPLGGLQAGITYYFKAISKNRAGSQTESPEGTFATPRDTTPPVLSNLTAINISESSATITWTTDELAYSQVIYDTTSLQQVLLSSNFTPVTTQLTTQHSVQLTGLTAGTTYYYYAKSNNPWGKVGESSPQQFSTTYTTQRASSPVRITYPNGGETLVQGNHYKIEWENPLTAPFAGDKNTGWWITILKGNSGSSQGSVPVGTSYYKWYFAGGNSPGNDYKVRVTLEPACIWNDAPCPDPASLLPQSNLLPSWKYGDESDAAFSIVAPTASTTPCSADPHCFTDPILGASYSEFNPLGLESGDFIKNLRSGEIFYVDEDLCFSWVPNESIAAKNFGSEWAKKIKSFYGVPQGYNFCESIR